MRSTVDKNDKRFMPSSEVDIQICQPITGSGTSGKPSGKQSLSV
jgi:hypothetical protein